MSERSVVRRLVADLRRRGAHVQRIEDAVSAGIPDVNFCVHGREGWVEVKWRSHWPRRPDTPVRTTLSAIQTMWIEDRRRAGGRAWVLLQVERDVFLVDGNEAGELRNGLTRDQLRAVAVAEGWGAVLNTLTEKEVTK